MPGFKIATDIDIDIQACVATDVNAHIYHSDTSVLLATAAHVRFVCDS